MVALTAWCGQRLITLERMKLFINPKYERLQDFILHLEENFQHGGELIHKGRNEIKVFDVDGVQLCVKHFGEPGLRGRLARTFLRSSKAKKAFVRPLELRERGFDSPEPVAYVCYREGLTRQSTYYVCLHSHYRHSMEDIMDLPPEERDELVKQLGVYCARLHADGFLHRDFSPDNVLFDKIDGRYRFSLIDTNSIKTGKPVSMEQGEHNLKQLDTSQGLFGLLLAVYRDEREKLKG